MTAIGGEADGPWGRGCTGGGWGAAPTVAAAPRCWRGAGHPRHLDSGGRRVRGAAPYGIASLLAATVVLMVAASSGMVAYGAHRRSRGRLTASEREQVLRQEAWTRARQDAVLLRARLLAKDPPPTLQPWDVVAHHGEVFFCDVLAGYARYYGTTVTYPRASGFFYGRPAFVLTGLAATAIGNAATRARAQALAQEQWREHGPCRLLVSNRRLLTHVRGRWLPYDYSTMTAVYPALASRP